MADISTTTRTLAVGLEYTKKDDGSKKTVYLKLPNPRAEYITEQGIKGRIQPLIDSSNPVLLTPDGEKFVGNQDAIVTAYTEVIETVEFDIGVS